MSAEHFKYCVLGGGNASGYAAREFVAGGLQPGELCIITAEPVVSYERPALSKGYLAPEGAARLPGFHTCVGGGGERQASEWYAEKGITFKTSTKVVSADLAAKTLTTEAGAAIKFDNLIIATGARPVYLSDFKLPGADLGGVHYLRDEADAAKLVAAIKEVKASGGSQEVVVVGGGYIGMEVAAGLASNGLQATIVMPEDFLLARLFTPKLAEFYEKFYAAKGIKFVKGASVTALESDAGKAGPVVVESTSLCRCEPVQAAAAVLPQGGAQHVTHAVVKSKSGEETKLPARLVVVGVGARPNTELFAGQLELAGAPVGGIKVDSHMRTSVPGVYAVGDVAAFPLLRANRSLVRQEHVTHCRSSAAHAVKEVLGTSAGEYDYLPYFYSRVFNLSWQFWGATPADAEIVHFGDFEAGKFGAYWVSGGKVVGVFLESASPEEAAAAKKLALETPAAPSPASSLAEAGLSFATSRM